MIDSTKYVILSLELHLFFARIMKEHALFLEAAISSKNVKLTKEAETYKEEFEALLLDTVKLSNKRIRENVLGSGEIISDYTLAAERKTECYTGININTKITLMEANLKCGMKPPSCNTKTIKAIKQLNRRAMKSVDCLIDFKKRILEDVLDCKIFVSNYPTLLEHIIHEAKAYRSYISSLENGIDIENINCGNIKDKELFWNDIMKEHALFMRGLLDPSEEKLVETADEFSKIFDELINNTKNMNAKTKESITDATLEETIKLAEFKKSGTEGIVDCKIKSIILPLLADHVLREANYYIRGLKDYKDK